MTANNPSTSGTYGYDATTSEIVLEAFERCQVGAAALTADHMVAARRSMNIILTSEWANKGPNLWAVDLFPIYLGTGSATYSLPANTVCLFDVFLRINAGQETQVDYTLYPISRTDYAQTPNKTQQAQPTVFWFNRQESPNVTFWATPDDNGPYIVYAWRMRTLQDSAVSLGEVPDIPTRFTEALCAALAFRLAVKYAPAARAVALKGLADESWNDAMKEDRERVTIFAGPDFSAYFR